MPDSRMKQEELGRWMRMKLLCQLGQRSTICVCSSDNIHNPKRHSKHRTTSPILKCDC